MYWAHPADNLMQTSQSKDGDFSSGLFLLYCGIASLFYTRKKEKTVWAGSGSGDW